MVEDLAGFTILWLIMRWICPCRPWVDSPQAPLMKETTKTVVTFPSEDEDMGEVSINWFGPAITVSCKMLIHDALLSAHLFKA